MKYYNSNGRGCARSAIALKLANELIEDGILDRPIHKLQLKQGGDVYYYFTTEGYYHRAGTRWLETHPIHEDDELWSPSFIDPPIWEKAVASFRSLKSLDNNVEEHLLPLLNSYIQQIADEEVILLTRNYLLEKGVLNTPIRQKDGDTYYFDDNEVYSLDQGSKCFQYDGRLKLYIFQVFGASSFNGNVWNKAAKQFKVGMTLSECIRIFLDTELDIKPKKEVPYIDRLIQFIEAPEYERVPENQNEATFDRIRVRVGLPRYMFQTWDELKEAVVNNRSEIDRRVLERIEKDRHFKKFKIPINFIKLSDVLLTRAYALEYIFELKE